MSSEKYHRPAGFPEWVNSAEEEDLIGEALAFDIPPLGLASKNSCVKFINTKKSLSAPIAGKYFLIVSITSVNYCFVYMTYYFVSFLRYSYDDLLLVKVRVELKNISCTVFDATLLIQKNQRAIDYQCTNVLNHASRIIRWKAETNQYIMIPIPKQLTICACLFTSNKNKMP